ncbi:MAG: Crp/Fnr family transcriptional regulator [Prolixibacteraceae bacterium]|jgi:CRP-like cAMP-binding protein|nr:Crp/Fnr family transcriptional regulator [Prolixibacteraceae bacterium]MDI9564836.1 Crp/Fnr family transcriptional regulator [Bacteroidota bacterium]NLT00827.1 Crp/Fnr family transcriptional regulator [Bacteroidales bacterium]OQB78093.1 MAG: cAMP receptor protein [Bacteroidetes bacterium ADurb.Bin123]HNU76783.1 Crp/Fnr family transcriptional regulator [Prolixibacteraceae bacterium]
MWHFESGIKEILENQKSVFHVLTPEEKEELKNHISLTNYRKNEYVFKEGDKPSGFMVLVTGKVKIFKEGVGGREQIIRMSKPMGIIGYRALFADENHIATAVTLEDSMIANITMDFILNRAVKNSEFSLLLLRKFALELGFANSRTVSLTQKHIRGRLAESLILLAEKYGFEHDNTTLKVYMSREDIANLSNMTTSNAIRTLSTFANEKLITIDGRKIKILDLARLDRISKLG